MGSLKGKHMVTEIAGTRVSVVETGATEARKEFLAGLLQQNGYSVLSDPEKSKDGSPLGTYVVGVTDLLFNPVIMVYERRLYRADGNLVTPAFWEQKAAETEVPYWQVER